MLKNSGAFFQALLCALPINLVPIIATFSVFIAMGFRVICYNLKRDFTNKSSPAATIYGGKRCI
jgi:hypothetical protein